ncbi:FUSC family protein [Microbulbifer sediminum]|uniref:FUSC family protein n=1 Tax=Microbulbifer sediminum TaxID=2904250 RepID=UPI001F359494|nr:FUSC family protein [Microbulbifer sediminum]
MLKLPPLSVATRESIKTALAMVSVYGITLSLDWGKAAWAGLAVAVVSQSSLGMSLHKAALRMLGTLMAVVAALVIVAHFPQDRWLFMAALSSWLGVCTYLSLGAKDSYFWQIGGWVSVIICVNAATSHSGAFEIAMLRTQQTGLGILVYSLVALLIWPRNSRGDLREAFERLQSAQLALFQECRAVLAGAGRTTALVNARSDLVHAQSAVSPLLDAAIADSHLVHERRREWQQLLASSTELTELLERLSESLYQVDDRLLRELLPGIDSYCSGVERRLQALTGPVGEMQPGEPQEYGKIAVEAARIPDSRLLDSAVVTVLRRLLQRVSEQVDSVAQAACAISNEAKSRGSKFPAVADTGAASRMLGNLMPDPDRLGGVARVIFTIWLAYLGYLYVDGLPAGPLILSLAASLSIALAAMPFVAPRKIFLPVLVAILCSGAIYLLVLPHLSTFWSLGPLIFGVTFALCLLFSGPRRAAGRSIALAFFVSVMGISNSQVYSFSAVANMLVVVTLLLILLSFAAYIPFSPRPERMFQRQLGQFMCSCAWLLTGRPTGWRSRYHRNLVARIPARLSLLAGVIERRYLPGDSEANLRAVVARCEALAARINALVEARLHAGDVAGKNATGAALESWQGAAADALERLAAVTRKGERPAPANSSAREGAQLREIENLLRQYHGATGAPAGSQPDGRQLEGALLLLGVSRSVSELLASLTEQLRGIDWRKWSEPRFF